MRLRHAQVGRSETVCSCPTSPSTCCPGRERLCTRGSYSHDITASSVTIACSGAGAPELCSLAQPDPSEHEHEVCHSLLVAFWWCALAATCTQPGADAIHERQGLHQAACQRRPEADTITVVATAAGRMCLLCGA